jgi:8-oxo-dGTP diphosphatase
LILLKDMDDRPKVGLGLFIVKDDQILLGKRKNSHGEGEYALPGGHLEHNESFEECLLRELAEEVGPDFKVTEPEFLCLTNLRRYLPKHYINIGMTTKWISGEPKVMEPDKVENWEWFDIDDLPEPLFGSTTNYVQAHKTGKYYFKD